MAPAVVGHDLRVAASIFVHTQITRSQQPGE